MRVGIIADDLTEGDPIVVKGNYVLEDGMEVETKDEAASQATTAPAEAKP